MALAVPRLSEREIEVGQMLAKGAFGNVHRARVRGQDAALKRFEREQDMLEGAKEIRLAQAAIDVWRRYRRDPPPIARPVGYTYLDGRTSAVAWELLSGDLARKIPAIATRVRALPDRCRVAARIARRLAQGIYVLRLVGWHHCDLKPGNVGVRAPPPGAPDDPTDPSRYVLIDFGGAVHHASPEFGSQTYRSNECLLAAGGKMGDRRCNCSEALDVQNLARIAVQIALGDPDPIWNPNDAANRLAEVAERCRKRLTEGGAGRAFMAMVRHAVEPRKAATPTIAGFAWMAANAARERS